MKFANKRKKAQQVIYLLGFMAAGKSYQGRRWAAEWGAHWVDLDQYISEREQMSIAELFALRGEAHFRALERYYLHQLLQMQQASGQKWLISLGGGFPCYGDNMEWLLQTGFCIFLNPPISVIYERLNGENSSRPVLGGRQGLDLLRFIQHLYLKRYPYYSKADAEWAG